jgi:hypothetical protein
MLTLLSLLCYRKCQWLLKEHRTAPLCGHQIHLALWVVENLKPHPNSTMAVPRSWLKRLFQGCFDTRLVPQNFPNLPLMIVAYTHTRDENPHFSWRPPVFLSPMCGAEIYIESAGLSVKPC